MKVDWISWRTNKKEIINPSLIEEQMDSYFDRYYTLVKPMVYEPLKSEILNGGLSKEAFNLSGESPSNEMAIEIINKIEHIKLCYDQLKASLRKYVDEQKEIEKRQLEDALREKIENEKQNLSELSSNPDYYEQVQRLNEKLEKVQKL